MTEPDPLHESAPRPPVVDVVILTHNDGELLTRAIASVLQDQLSSAAVHVWVIDNASEPPATVVQHPDVTLVRNDANLGVGGGRNQGVGLGGAPLVCILDSDARLEPGALDALTAPFDDATVGLTVPVFTDQLPTQSAGLAPTPRVKVQRALNRRTTYEAADGTGDGQWWDVDFGIGACQMFRRESFDCVGGIDESDPFGPEDVDFCLRVRAAGWRVLQVADARVVHPPRRSHRSLVSRRGLRHALAIARHFLHRRRYRVEANTTTGDTTPPGH